MKVILLENVENVGEKYEVKEVKNGFARNFLIPNKLAKLADKKALKWLGTQKEGEEKKAEEELKKSQELASRIDDIEVNIAVKAGSQGQLFESVNNQKISEKLVEMGFNIKKSQINLAEPIKEIGEFPVKISLAHNLEAEILVIVAEEETSTKKEL